MKIVKLWTVNRVAIVDKEELHYMPEHYDKDAICINDHWVYVGKRDHKRIKTLGKEHEMEVVKLQKQLNKVYAKAKKIKAEINSTIDRIYKEMEGPE